MAIFIWPVIAPIDQGFFPTTTDTSFRFRQSSPGCGENKLQSHAETRVATLTRP